MERIDHGLIVETIPHASRAPARRVPDPGTIVLSGLHWPRCASRFVGPRHAEQATVAGMDAGLLTGSDRQAKSV
jgi:hypothetical protein